MAAGCAILATGVRDLSDKPARFLQHFSLFRTGSEFKVTIGFLPVPIRSIEICPIFSRNRNARHF
jgi:hypothetical protein